MLYAISDVNLPFPVTFQQIGCFFAGLVIVLFVPVFELIGNPLIRYFALPGVFAWGVTQKTFDGKKPLSFLKTVILYCFRPKVTFAGKPVKCKKRKEQGEITAVWTTEGRKKIRREGV